MLIHARMHASHLRVESVDSFPFEVLFGTEKDDFLSHGGGRDPDGKQTTHQSLELGAGRFVLKNSSFLAKLLGFFLPQVICPTPWRRETQVSVED